MRIITTPKPLPASPPLLRSVAYLFLFFTVWALFQMLLAYWQNEWLFHPAVLSILIYRGLLEQRLAWRNLALWVAVFGMIAYLLGLLGILFDFLYPIPPAIQNQAAVEQAINHRGIGWAFHLSFPAYLWINYVLRRADIRRLFYIAPEETDANTH